MRFSDVIGQEAVKRRLARMIADGEVPHALLFAGPEGCGKLPMALALAERLLCTRPDAQGDACGECAACRMAGKLAHPDLHFVFPVFKPAGQSAPAVSDHFLKEWREQVAETPYFSRQTWLKRIGVENQQSLINVAEANNVIQKLSNVSSQGGYRVIIVWLAEQMNSECANKLLKILEEPPLQTVFVLTADHPERLLATIRSRTRRIDFPPLQEIEVAEALQRIHGLQPEDARVVARTAAGNYIRATEQVTLNADAAQFFDLFVLFMRLCYMRRIKDLHQWAMQLAGWGREKQKAFLDYCQRMIRENFVYNFRRPDLSYLSRQEADFAVRFAPFINERNVIGMTDEVAAAQRDIEQNVNAKMVFFDLALKVTVLFAR